MQTPVSIPETTVNNIQANKLTNLPVTGLTAAKLKLNSCETASAYRYSPQLQSSFGSCIDNVTGLRTTVNIFSSFKWIGIYRVPAMLVVDEFFTMHPVAYSSHKLAS